MNNSVLTKLLDAPINLFYDVTNTGRIMHTIHHDLGVFEGELQGAVGRIIGTLIHTFAVLSIVAYGTWKFCLTISITAYVIYKMKVWWQKVDQRLNKVSSGIHRRLGSSFSEALKGTTVIRAFKKQSMFTEHQIGMVDQTTL